MKVVTAAEMRLLDRLAIERGAASLDLMERAGIGVAGLVAEWFSASPLTIAVVAGAGNNAGDGFVAARLLAQRGQRVTTYLTHGREKLSVDARTNFDRLEPLGVAVYDISEPELLERLAEAIERADVVVDALFGTGLDRELSPHLRNVVTAMNRSRGKRLAIDIPSGLHAETGESLGVAVQADVTATLGFPKISLVSHPGFVNTGELRVIDIGISDSLAEEVGVRVELLEAAYARSLLPARPGSGHKGTFGHVLVVAGSRDKPGAALLCAEGVLRAGAGLCTVASTPGGREAIAGRVLEVMTPSFSQSDEPAAAEVERILELATGKEALVVGPGIPTNDGMRDIVFALVRSIAAPLVLDADGLNSLAGRTGALRQATAPVVLTPHPGEMARLCGRSVAEVQSDRVGVARRFAAETNTCVVLKGARTVVASTDGRAWINPTGNSGMATGGTGDVLAGLIGGFLSQNVPTVEAACLAVYLHGLAGDRAASRLGQRSMLARDLLEEIPFALRDLEK